MLNLSKKSVTKHHRFNYHPRNYDERKEAFKKREIIVKNRAEDPHFDVIEHYKNKRRQKPVRFDLIFIAVCFFLVLIFQDTVNSYLSQGTRFSGWTFTVSGFAISFSGIGSYLLLISLGIIFVKRSNKKNV